MRSMKISSVDISFEWNAYSTLRFRVLTIVAHSSLGFVIDIVSLYVHNTSPDFFPSFFLSPLD